MGLMAKHTSRWAFSGPRRRAERSPGARRSSVAGHLISQTVSGLLIAAISGGLFWLVWIYGNGLRDPRYLDGWVLAGGMSVQFGFHIAIKTSRLSPKAAARLRSIHIFMGYLLIAAFLSHANFSLPDTALEWSLWLCFWLVMASGLFGTYLTWSLKSKRGIDERVGYDRIATRRAEMARDVQAVVTMTDTAATAIALPATSHEVWIIDLYAKHLRNFFAGPRNFSAQLIGSQRPLRRLTDEIDNLSRYVDKQTQEKLETIKTLAVEKDRLDFTRVHLALTNGWLFVHVPITYALIVLSVLHVIVVYAFSSGAW